MPSDVTSRSTALTESAAPAGPAAPDPIPARAIADDDRGADEHPPRRWKPLAVLLSLVVVAVGAYVVGSQRTRSPEEVAASTRPPPRSDITATVARRGLQAKVITRATIGSVGATDVACAPTTGTAGASAGAGGRAVFTRRPVNPGTDVAEGQVLAEINGRPVIMLQGDVASFREITPGSTGVDVSQLQAALNRLGFPSQDTSGTYGPGTQAAVAAWYRSLGYTAAEAPKEDVDAVRSAQSALEQALSGQRQAKALLARAAQEPGADVSEAQSAVAEANRNVTNAQADLAQLTPRIGTRVSYCELVFVPRLPAVIDRVPEDQGSTAGASASASGGASETTASGPGASGSAWARISGGALVLQGTVNAGDADLLQPGMAVRFGDDAGDLEGGTTGTIGDIGAAKNGDKRVTITPDRPLAGASLGQNVKVVIPVRATAGEVLVVPLAAVSARADGSARVTKVVPAARSGDGSAPTGGAAGTRVEVGVDAGLSADGYVEVSPRAGESLVAGDEVLVGQ